MRGKMTAWLVILVAVLLVAAMAQAQGLTYYVHGDTGDDAAVGGGLNPLLPLKTLSAAQTASVTGDIINCAGTLRAAGSPPTGAATNGPCEVTFSSKSNLTIQQWANQTQAVLRGDVQLLQTGWTASTNAWQKTITAGLTITRVQYKWDGFGVDAEGRHKGHLFPDTLANVQNATGDVGRFNYVSGTGVLTVYLGTGVNPNTSGFPVSYESDGDVAGLYIVGGTGHVVSGLDFVLYCMVGQSNCVRIDDAQNSIIRNCRAYDIGNHAFLIHPDGDAIRSAKFSDLGDSGSRRVCKAVHAVCPEVYPWQPENVYLYALRVTAWAMGASHGAQVIPAVCPWYCHPDSRARMWSLIPDDMWAAQMKGIEDAGAHGVAVWGWLQKGLGFDPDQLSQQAEEALARWCGGVPKAIADA